MRMAANVWTETGGADPAPAGVHADFGLAFESRDLAALTDYWRSKRRGDAFPARADIVPGEIRSLLPAVMIVEVVEGGRDFRYRLVGTALARTVRTDPTGLLMSETTAFPEIVARYRWAFREVLRARAPLRTVSDAAVVPELDFLRGENAVLPLATAGVIDKILVGCDLLKPLDQGGGSSGFVARR